MELEAKIAIVAGGTGALGQAITATFLEKGATVAVPYVVAAELDALTHRLEPNFLPRLYSAPTDVSDEAAMSRFVGSVLGRYGRVDILVNGVGGFAMGEVVSTDPATWERMLSLNLTTAFVGCRAVLRHMMGARSGRIINIASRAVLPVTGGFTAYTVAKVGVIALTQALAIEAKPHGITVNAVAPSTMDTPANRAAMPQADFSKWVKVESVAEVIAFLAGDSARDITGAVLTV